MEHAIMKLEQFLSLGVEVGIVAMEIFGLIILLTTGVRSFIKWIKRMDGILIYLGRGIALALEFKMGAEVLKTVIVREWKELGILGAIIIMRIIMTFIIHWEIAHEEKHDAI